MLYKIVITLSAKITKLTELRWAIRGTSEPDMCISFLNASLAITSIFLLLEVFLHVILCKKLIN